MRLWELIILGPLGPVAAVVVSWYLDRHRGTRRPSGKKKGRRHKKNRA